MDIFWLELTRGMPDKGQIVRIIIRLMASMIVGAIIGAERERNGKPAGLRTHMLVTLGSTLFILIPLEVGMSIGDLSRVIQGIATGIGFIGGGAILKLNEERDIQGLTTAAGIWMTSAIGIAIGVGRLGVGLLCALLTLLILTFASQIERWLYRKRNHQDDAAAP